MMSIYVLFFLTESAALLSGELAEATRKIANEEEKGTLEEKESEKKVKKEKTYVKKAQPNESIYKMAGQQQQSRDKKKTGNPNATPEPSTLPPSPDTLPLSPEPLPTESPAPLPASPEPEPKTNRNTAHQSSHPK